MKSQKRESEKTRKTKETNISLKLNIDGTGKYAIKTPIPFFNHMLELFSKHGFFDLTLKASGDVDVDDHHLVEDVGITLAEAFRNALNSKAGIARYGFFVLTMDEVLTTVALDLSGRASFHYNTPLKSGRIKDFDVELVEHFFESFAQTLGMNLHILVHYGKNKHHIVESIFKCWAKALDRATTVEPRLQGVLSTKGKL